MSSRLKDDLFLNGDRQISINNIWICKTDRQFPKLKTKQNETKLKKNSILIVIPSINYGIKPFEVISS